MSTSGYLNHAINGRIGHYPVFVEVLIGQILKRVYRKRQLRHGQHSYQVSGVGGGDDEGEEPPESDQKPQRL